jgi:excinuclease ABC subunit C
MEISDHIKGILDTLPLKPGCYIMKNSAGQILYVGKAIRLRDRVRSYFHSNVEGKTRRLVREIADIEFIIVGSELEALILEMTLIKRHRPRYNVRLKDDKRYPYIKVHWKDDFPTVTVTRQMSEDGSRYYGPYTSAWAVYQTLDVLRRIFPYLTCDREITGADTRACLYYDIKLCAGPCVGKVNKDEYRAMLNDLGDFLNGKSAPVVDRLRSEMDRAAEELRFERAAALRDQITAIGRVVEKQKVISAEAIDSDVMAMARADGEACVQIFFIRGGKLIGREYFVLEGTEESTDAEVMSQFVKQFYAEAANLPSQVLLPEEIEEAQIIQQWLRDKRGGSKVEMTIPRNDTSTDLIKMAAENASETLQALRAQWQADAHKQEQALGELQSGLMLSAPPNRIECYDVSHTQGVATVGAMVVFTQGVPDKKLYRKFNIDTLPGAPDDFASMEEMLTRRFKRWAAAQESAAAINDQPGKKLDESFSFLPDLIIIDGGKGQLSRAVSVLEQFDLLGKVPVVGLAKQQEEIFFPHKSESLMLPRHSQALYLVQRIRDEAHRFGITAHRNKRGKIGLASRLDAIPGIGPAKRKSLLKHFGSIDKIKDASIEELTQLPGIHTALAETIKANLE